MDKYKWDLTKIFKNEEEYNNAKNEANSLCNEIIEYKGRILESSDSLLKFLELDNRLDYLIEKLYIYSFLGYYDNMADVKFQKFKEEILALENKISSMTSFITPELLSHKYSEVLELIDKDERLKKYKLSLERTFKYKDHTLSEKEEKLLSEASEILRIPSSTFAALDNIDVKYEKVIGEDGKKTDLTVSNYGTFIQSRNRVTRKDAFKKLNKFYKEHINTISNLYIGKVKSNGFISRARNYDSILDMYLFPDDVNSKLYNKLIKVTNKNTKSLKEYYKLKSKVLGYKLHMYDLYVNISKSLDKKIKYEEAIDIVNNALKPLGEDYLKVFNHLLNNHCVDVYPKDKKRGGAYEWGIYGVEPYVSLNYENDFDSVSTLAHEMGHAMHTYYSNKNQDFMYADYPIFLAEIASTVNEVLLSEYMLNNTKDKNEKIYYLVEFLDKFKGTVFRQVMFADFENIIHEKYENGESLTMELLCDEYLKLNKKHFSPVIKVDEDIKYEWARIPHFYTSFYVYKYATGFISALLIVDKLLNDSSFKDKYIKFLSSGNIDYPLNLLKELNIDLTDEKVLNRAFEIFSEKLDMLKKLEKEE